MQKGIQLLIKMLRREFSKENEDLYSEEDYRKAEKRYLKLRLNGNS